jgi:DNA polymerase-3 subunit alpha
MEYIDEYVARKHGRTRWSTPHPIMTEVLAETYGIMVYQEQVSRLVNRLGNVPLRRAFRLAKAISKKKESMIEAEHGPFITGAVSNGVSRETAEEVFQDILKFGGYAFNKAHSTGYALVAFQTAHLKTYYPLEFMAALLTYESGSTDKVAEYIDECRRMRLPDGSVGIAIKPPDVNESEEAFTVVYPTAGADGKQAAGARRGHICFGLAAISGVGHKAVQAILAAREGGGRFRDLYDFCERVDLAAVNKGVIEALIKSGAFDSTGAMRRALMSAVEKAIELGQEAHRDRKAGQLNMFGGFESATPARPPTIGSEEWTDSEMLAYEKATLGFYITKHPLTQYEELVRRFSTCSTADLERVRDGTQVVLGGLVARVRTVPIKQGRSAGKKLVIAVLEDFVGSVEVVVFPDQQAEAVLALKPDTVVFVEGAVDRRREEPSVRAARVVPVDQVQREYAREVVIKVRSAGAELAALPQIHELCRTSRGACAVYFEVSTPGGWTATVRAREASGVDPSDDFLRAVATLEGVTGVLCSGRRST